MEDEEIHCLKEGGAAADNRESIQRDIAVLTTATDTELEESDPFADVEDELEENKLVLEDCYSIILCFNSTILNKLYTYSILFACFDIAIESRGLFTYATRILAVDSIQERRLFHSAHPEVWRQFESGD